MNVMPLREIDDWEMRIRRQDAFWHKEILDRPVVCMEIPKQARPAADRGTTRWEERWLDADFQAAEALAAVRNTEYLGDALPVAYPNLGPDFFPACFGGRLRFEETTSYIEPFLQDWDDLNPPDFPPAGIYFKKMEELYERFLRFGEGMYYTGWPDLHGGADCLVGFRGPMNFNFDVEDNKGIVKEVLEKITGIFLLTYDHYHQKLISRRQPVTGWPGIVSTVKWHVPSNDFSCMISTELFEELFLDGLIAEMRHMEANIYHLDGPGALRHLDLLLTIPELSAIQWVYGAGNGRASDHLSVYKKIQKAGKGIQIQEVFLDELGVILEELNPEGVWMKVYPADRDQAETVLRKIRKWGTKRR